MSEQQVEHPNHYNWVPGIECIDVVRWFNFNLGNSIKYIWRSGKKPDTSAINDLEKAKYYLELEIDRLKEVGLAEEYSPSSSIVADWENGQNI